MDAATILEIKPALTTFLHEFDGCFGRRTTTPFIASLISTRWLDVKHQTHLIRCLAATGPASRRPISAKLTRPTPSVAATRSPRVLA
jgi:hypothetical protein